MKWGITLALLAAGGNLVAADRLLLWQAADTEAAVAITKTWAEERDACAERDLVVRPIRAVAERKAFGVAPGKTAIVLVGKDGGVKARWTTAVSPTKVFAVIDAMPMRRAEMRRE